jgi:predicted DNA-binding transcriptional regulator AlpA
LTYVKEQWPGVMTAYVVSVAVWLEGDSAAANGIEVPAMYERLGRLLDELSILHGAVAGDGRGWGATVTVDSASVSAAANRSIREVMSRADRLGLPTEPLSRIEVIEEGFRDSELEIPNLPDLVSGPEAAKILGVSRQRVHQLATENTRFPTPAYRLGVGSLWLRAAIVRFSETWERKVGRPKKAAT